VLAAACAVVFGQGLVALVVFVVTCSLLVLWRSRTRKRLAQRGEQVSALISQVDALANQIKTGEGLRKIQAQELMNLQLRCDAAEEAMQEAEDSLRIVRRYETLQRDVANGLYYALWNGGTVGGDIVHFIEDNSLKPINDTFIAELVADGEKVRVETGIARQTSYGFQVTHASGQFTKELRRDGGCNSARTIEAAVALKAAAFFVKDGWYVVPLTDTDPLEYLFVLSNVVLGESERASIDQQAPLIKITMAALRSAREKA
jgi:hypothetical protein